MRKLAVIISPNWKDYAKRFLHDCLASLRAQTMQEFDLILVDNESSPESLEYLKSIATEATIISLEKNEGFAGGNNAAIKEAMKQGYEYVFLVNMDTVLEADCLVKIMQAAEEEPDSAIQARLMMYPDKQKVNSLGNSTHFLGFGYSLGNNELYDPKNNRREIAYPSGAAVLFPCKALEEIGLFDEEMWMYNEDQDLGWRFWLSGRKCLIANDAVVYHKYEFSRSITKYYWMDRNRIIAIIKNYRLLSLICIFPAFIIMEIGLILFSLKSGWFKEKLKVWMYFSQSKNIRYLVEARRKTQGLRKSSDRRITKYFSGIIWYQEIDDYKLRIINPIFSLYWRIVRMIMFW